MLELINVEKQVQLRLNAIGYQFPEDVHDDWCLIELQIQQGDRVFKKTDPALEAAELVRLLSWIECLAENRLPRFSELAFTEPCISFSFLACHEGIVRISIELDYELKPDFELEQFGDSHSEWGIIFELTPSDFDKTICGLTEAIKRYPIRDTEE